VSERFPCGDKDRLHDQDHCSSQDKFYSLLDKSEIAAAEGAAERYSGKRRMEDNLHQRNKRLLASPERERETRKGRKH
jgi:hypothetical protein